MRGRGRRRSMSGVTAKMRPQRKKKKPFQEKENPPERQLEKTG